MLDRYRPGTLREVAQMVEQLYNNILLSLVAKANAYKITLEEQRVGSSKLPFPTILTPGSKVWEYNV